MFLRKYKLTIIIRQKNCKRLRNIFRKSFVHRTATYKLRLGVKNRYFLNCISTVITKKEHFTQGRKYRRQEEEEKVR